MDCLRQIYLLQSSFLVDYATASQHERTLWLRVCCQAALLKVNQMWVKWRTPSSQRPHLKSRADIKGLYNCFKIALAVTKGDMGWS